MKRKIQVWQYFHGVTEHCFWWKLIILFYFMSTIILLLSLSVYANCRDPPPCFKKMHYSSNLESCNPLLIGSGKKKLTHLPVEHKRFHYHQQSSIIERERERESHIIVLLCVLRLFFLPRNMLIHCIFWFRMLEKKKAQKITILWMVAHFKF